MNIQRQLAESTKAMHRLARDRKRYIALLVKQGHKRKDIARQFGITTERVRQLLAR